jgi:hypothetical protein
MMNDDHDNDNKDGNDDEEAENNMITADSNTPCHNIACECHQDQCYHPCAPSSWQLVPLVVISNKK